MYIRLRVSTVSTVSRTQGVYIRFKVSTVSRV